MGNQVTGMLEDFYQRVSEDPTQTVAFGQTQLSILHPATDIESFKPDSDHFLMAKSTPYIEGYLEIARKVPIHRVLEIGIYKGGSVVFFDNVFDLKQLTAIDLSKTRLPNLDAYVARQGRSKAIGLHYGIDQGDRAALEAILASDFPRWVDLVIDDASHFYGPSRVSFETIFPKLKPGGVYVIEDWSWAHSKPSDGGDNEDGTRLMHEIIALHAKDGGMVSAIDFRPGFCAVTRGRSPMPPGVFRLADYALQHVPGGAPPPPPPPPPPVSLPVRAVRRLLRELGLGPR
jgi:predicted O-methyltransferase YrrM